MNAWTPIIAVVDSAYVLLGIVIFLLLVAANEFYSRGTRLERKMDALLKHHNITPPEMSGRVKALAKDPNMKIEAIKALREETGMGLADAKAQIEAFSGNTHRPA